MIGIDHFPFKQEELSYDENQITPQVITSPEPNRTRFTYACPCSQFFPSLNPELMSVPLKTRLRMLGFHLSSQYDCTEFEIPFLLHHYFFLSFREVTRHGLLGLSRSGPVAQDSGNKSLVFVQHQLINPCVCITQAFYDQFCIIIIIIVTVHL